MNLNELKRLVAKGESDWVEFQESIGQRTKAAKSICATANGMGEHHPAQPAKEEIE